MAVWQIPWCEDPEHSGQGRLRLEALRGHQWVLTGIDTSSRLDVAYQW